LPSGIVVFPLSKTLLHGFTTSIQCFTEPAHAENYIPWLLITDGMRRPVSGRDAVYAPKFIDVLRSECVREGPVLLLFVCAGSSLGISARASLGISARGSDAA
jgi:hypothetical protein